MVTIIFIIRFLLVSLSVSICASEQLAKRKKYDDQDQLSTVLALVAKEYDTQKAKEMLSTKIAVPSGEAVHKYSFGNKQIFDYKKFIKETPDSLQCAVCPHTFLTAPNQIGFLNSAVWTHFNKKHENLVNDLEYEKKINYSCPICNESFKTKILQQSHINKQHPNSEHTKLFECDLCNYKFTNYNTLKSHIKRSKNNNNNNNCPKIKPPKKS